VTTYEFRLPDLAEGTTEGEIAAWRVTLGQQVREDEPLVDVMTDKAVVEIPSPVTGTIASLQAAVGEKVAVGAILVVFHTVKDAPGADMPVQHMPAAPTGALSAAPTSSASTTAAVSIRPTASPSVRRRAHEADVSLATVRGSGPGGRILHADLNAALSAKSGAAPVVPATATVTATVTAPVTVPEVEEIALVGMRRKIAERMAKSKSTIPHFGYVEEIDVTELEALRSHLNAQAGEDRTRLTPLPFIMLAVAKVLPAFPDINATFDADRAVLRRHRGIHIGVATQTPAGLLVPVVRHVETRGLWQCAAELVRVTAAAREGRATREELTGSTITLTSLGALGGIAATPIINYPELAIIGPNRIIERPVVRDGAIVIRKLMNLSSSFDHRLIDGYVAAQFIQRLKSHLEMPATLFIDER
jgi:2-oxoisovalerate dehydrogenase E2 component (dihydrolipoyl transacylase)